MASPLCSVVLPYRDAAPTLAQACESVLSERDVPLELLAIDDGSRDDGPAIVLGLAQRDPRVRAISCGGRGLVAALRLGVELGRGRYLARMDGDDVSLPGRLAAQLEALEREPTLGLVGSRVEAFPPQEVGEGLRRYVEWQNGLVTPEDHARELFIEAPLCHPSVVFRAEVLRAVGGYRDVPWPEDYDLWLRLDAAGVAMAKVPRVLLRWRHHGGRATFNHPRYQRARFFDAKAEGLARRLRADGRPLWIWGAGPTGKRTARALEDHGVRAVAFIDIDPDKLGRKARGAPVVPVDALVPGEVFVVAAVGSLGARAIIRAALEAKGLREGVDYLCAA